MSRAYLSIGSNLDREHNIRSCLDQLAKQFGELKVSPVYESEAVGFNGSHFLNLVVAIETSLSLSKLSQKLKSIEDEHGRDRSGPKFGARTLDIDIVCFDELVGEYDGITLPRPELYYNAFVMLPMAELIPETIDAKEGKPYSELWQEMDSDQKLWQVPFDWSQQSR